MFALLLGLTDKCQTEESFSGMKRHVHPLCVGVESEISAEMTVPDFF